MDSNKKSTTIQKNYVTILGSGTSTGVPTPGCPCKLCQQAANNPSSKNNRLRTSIFLQTTRGKHILIDTTPDLRTQILQSKISQIDAVIITHDHADHIHGIDDLRPFCFFQERKEIPLHVTDYTKQQLEKRFEYIFNNTKKVIGGGIPMLTLHTVEGNITPNIIEEEEFTFFTLPHGHITSLGFFHQGLAYLTDCQEIPADVLNFLIASDVKLLIIDATRRKPHATHLHLEKSLNYIKQINPQQSRLIHLSHDFDHEQLCQEVMDYGLLNSKASFDGEKLSY